MNDKDIKYLAEFIKDHIDNMLWEHYRATDPSHEIKVRILKELLAKLNK